MKRFALQSWSQRALASRFALGAALLFSTWLRANPITKLSVGTELTSAASWDGNVAPGSADIATWITTSRAKTLTLAANTSWLGISISGGNGTLAVSGAGALTLGAAGITNSSIVNPVSLGIQVVFGADQGWDVSSALTVNVVSGPYSLTKSGSGTVTFQGGGIYGGSTTVTAGKVVFSSTQTGTGAVAVNDGAALGVIVSGTSTLSLPSLTLGTSTGLITNEFTGVASTAVAPVQVGALTNNGATTINILASSLSVGIYPLIHYTSISGSGGFVIGTLPSGVSANIITNGNAIALSVTGIATFVWTGATDGNWDTTTTNWALLGSPTNYVDNNPVQFNDTALNTNVVVAGSVLPLSVLVNNDALDFNFSGGSISGTAGVTKQGSGTLTFSQPNTYTGVTTVGAGGTLRLSGGNYTITKNNTVVVNGTLELTGETEQLSTVTGNGSILTGGGLFWIGVGTPTFTFAGVISGSGSFEKGGQGVVTLTGLNTYTGTTILQKGALSLGDGTTAGNVGNSVALQIGNGSSLIINYPSSSITNSFGGIISGNGSVTVSGGGKYTLLGANVYTGTTAITGNGAILEVDGSLAPGNLTTVGTGGTLSGIGTIGDVVSVNAGGTLAPGASLNVLGAITLSSDLNLSDGAVVLFGLNKTNALATNDSLSVAGSLNVTNGVLSVTNLGPALAAGDSFTLLSQPSSGFTTVHLPLGYTWANHLAVDGSIQVSAVINNTPPNFQPNSIARLNDGNISLTAAGSVGTPYSVWASTNLAAPNSWTLLKSGTIPSTPFTVTDQVATNYPQRFYRLSTP